MLPRRGRLHHEEHGAVAITTAILLAALVLMAAIVVDIGMLRVDHRDSQTVVDMAVTAGAMELSTGDNRIAACNAAWAYLINNLDEVPDDEPQPAPPDDCAGVFAGPCDHLVSEPPFVASLAGGTIEVEIRMPVLDGDTWMQEHRQTLDPDRDGGPCERISVEIRRGRSHTLAVIAGFQDGSSVSGAVGRRMEVGSADRFISLQVLDRTGCSVIHTSGGPSSIRVLSATVDGVEHPGTISVDSEPPSPASCSGNSKVFDVDSGVIQAEGDIFSHGLQQHGVKDAIYDDDPPALDPPPQSGPLITRRAFDHRYNCQTTYGTGPEPFLPESSSLSAGFRQDIEDCGDGDPSHLRLLYALLADYIEDLEDGGDGIIDDIISDLFSPAEEFAAAGFEVYGDDPGEPCDDIDIDASAGSVNTLWYFDCPAGARVRGGGTPDELTIPDADMVVFRNGLRVDGTVWINATCPGWDGTTCPDRTVIADGPSDATIAFWEGEMQILGQMNTRRSFIYLNNIDTSRLLTNGSGGIDLEAPLGGTCGTQTGINGDTWPTAECFEDLAVWQNEEGIGSSDRMQLNGSGILRTVGSVFVPNAQVEIGGGGATDLRSAQFYAWQFWYHGNGTLELLPNPERATPERLFGAGLIR